MLLPRLKWSLLDREAFARFARTLILIPTCFLFWMIAANYCGAEIPSAAPMGTIGALVLLTNISCLIVLSWRPHDRMFEVMRS
jgi:membrane protein implicated in regulation of membrane protease activity